MWIELHDGARDHPKVLKLARDLAISQVTALGHMVSLWAWTLRMAPDGNLSSFDSADIEIGAKWDGIPGAFVAACTSRRLLDLINGGYFVHDWIHYSGSLKVAERKRRERRRKRNPPPRDSHATPEGPSRDVTQNERPKERKNERINARARENSEFANEEKEEKEEGPVADFSLLFKVGYQKKTGKNWPYVDGFGSEIAGVLDWCEKKSKMDKVEPGSVHTLLLSGFFSDAQAGAAAYPLPLLASAPGRYYPTAQRPAQLVKHLAKKLNGGSS